MHGVAAIAHLPGLTPVLVAAGVALLLHAATTDVAVRLIPDTAALGLAAVGILLRLADHSLLPALAGAAAVTLAAAVCWLRGWMGGGDVKLLGACALLVAPAQITTLLLGTALIGGALAALYLLLGRLVPDTAPGAAARPAGRLARIWRVERRRIRRRFALPYGCAIAGAAIITLFASPGMPGK